MGSSPRVMHSRSTSEPRWREILDWGRCDAHKRDCKGPCARGSRLRWRSKCGSAPPRDRLHQLSSSQQPPASSYATARSLSRCSTPASTLVTSPSTTFSSPVSVPVSVSSRLLSVVSTASVSLSTKKHPDRLRFHFPTASHSSLCSLVSTSFALAYTLCSRSPSQHHSLAHRLHHPPPAPPARSDIVLFSAPIARTRAPLAVFAALAAYPRAPLITSTHPSSIDSSPECCSAVPYVHAAADVASPPVLCCTQPRHSRQAAEIGACLLACIHAPHSRPSCIPATYMCMYTYICAYTYAYACMYVYLGVYARIRWRHPHSGYAPSPLGCRLRTAPHTHRTTLLIAARSLACWRQVCRAACPARKPRYGMRHVLLHQEGPYALQHAYA
ncbi:hypothetical protein IWX90DRAFT_261269 [Phyllosticta citrichinensis]|uniref:Uncharacterized protein n=1 Tax=Phyllosticta citrichinensis TaxID=1130410 RepID=A0ABR1XS89_9PEZI